jgi:archaellum component FlaF (FlaF/FlaG flagellin family)
MTAISPQLPHTDTLRSGFSLTVNAPASGTATAVLTRGGAVIQSQALSSGLAFTFGPYNLDVQFRVTTTAPTTITTQESFLQVASSGYAVADATKQLVNTAVGSAMVALSVTDVILDGVATTFALTFPAPQGDKQVLRVMAATAVSVAFSTVVTAPATVIKTPPATLVAGTGLAWEYNASNTTWYRQV